MQSAAFVVGPRDGAGAAIVELARDAGLSPVDYYSGPEQALAQARTTPVCFFLVSSTVPKSAISAFVTDIRHHPDRLFRFSPVLFVCEDPSPRTISFCLQAGFDDIIAPPFTPPKIRARMKAQLNTPHLYFQTPTYFGPDRRRGEADRDDAGNRRGEVGAVRMFEVKRDPGLGMRVLNRRLPEMPAPQPACDAGLEVDTLLID